MLWCFAVFLHALVFKACQAAQSSSNRHKSSAPVVQIVDASGTSTSVGLLQVRAGEADAIEFGTVCGMNLAAADVVCAQLGFDYGTLGTSPCSTYGGSDLCGSPNIPVAMANLVCEGGELDIQECSFSKPSASCLGHERDSIVYCGGESSGGFTDGTLRLLSFDGSPSIDGVGRLEIFHGGAWGPVCSSGFTAGAAAVACKAMGFSGADQSSTGLACGNVGGKNYCSAAAPQLSEVSCSGQEVDLMACPHEDSDDVFCAPEESVVLRCAGIGDTQGRPEKLSAPQAGGIA